MSSIATIPFIDLQAQRRRLGTKIDEAIAGVLAHGQFVMGPEVGELERRLSAYCGAAHTISCGSGTDALEMILRALEIGQGDAVIVPSFTFVAAAEVAVLVGATPIFVDVQEADFCIDPSLIEIAVARARAAGLRARAVVVVDLYGQPADYDRLQPVADALGLAVIADAAQSFGAALGARKVGQFGRATAVSFFPSKPLGCYGDGGAVFTDDVALAEQLRSIRMHGQGHERYDHRRIGFNGRMDTLQAAILLAKLESFDAEIRARQLAAERYNAQLAELVATPQLRADARSVWAQYTIRTDNRDRLALRLKANGVPTAVHYPLPLHRQAAYRDFPVAGNGAPNAERLAATVLSLPIHGYLEAATQERIVALLKQAII